MGHHVELRANPGQRFAYAGRAVLVTDIHGGIPGDRSEGFYYEETRLLSCERLTVDGKPLEPVVFSTVDAASLLGYSMAPKGPTVPEGKVFVEIARFIEDGMRTVLRVENYAAQDSARFEFGIELDVDFADSTETHTEGSPIRQQSAPVERTWDAQSRELRFRYCRPGLDREVVIRVEHSPVPVRYERYALLFPLNLPPHSPVEVHISLEPVFDGKRRAATRRTFFPTDGSLGRVRDRLRSEAPILRTGNATVSRAWETAIADLASYPLGIEDAPSIPAAGIPLYQHFFGRDTLTIAWQALLAMPSLMKDSLKLNARLQGKRIDDWLDEEPGKLIHETRRGPLSVLGVDALARNYGDYATPPDFLIMLGQYLAWTGDMETVRDLLPAARATIEWLDRYGDLDGDGFIEYVTRSAKGIKNQGWRDSYDAIVDEDGTIIENPIATSELQAYWYAGLQQAALVFLAAGDAGYALELGKKARDLRRRFDRAFWMSDRGFYALALGPDKQQIRSVSSNPGHLLATGIVPREKGPIVARRLMAPDLYSGWAIRTLSSEHIAFNPFSYHLGSVWPVENGTFAVGFARYGCFEEMHRLAQGLFEMSDLFVANRLPESIGGITRDDMHPHPGIYPRSNELQGWSASAIILLVQMFLGICPVAPLRLLFIYPNLPPWLPELGLQGVRVGDATVDIEAWRSNGETRYRVTHRGGALRVIRQPPPDAMDTNLTTRLLTAMRGLRRG